jgi:putative two-component system response regulator
MNNDSIFQNDTPQELLLVDDDDLILNGFHRLFRQNKVPWHYTLAKGVEDALTVLEQKNIDAVVTDIRMPTHDGLDFLNMLRNSQNWNDLPVVVMTGINDPVLKSKAINMGATDLLYKPIHPDDLMARIRSVLHAKKYSDTIKLQNSYLSEIIQQRTEALEATKLEMIRRLARAAEFRSNETGFHLIRVGYYSKVLSSNIGMDKDFIDAIYLTSPLHDLGKIGIPDSILLKNGQLTDIEWEIMKTHCVIGMDLLKSDCFEQSNIFATMNLPLGNKLNREPNRFLQMAADIAGGHHERWDGSGYPHGKKHDEIPLSARIVAICDVYDALRSKRAYKAEMQHDEAVALMRKESSFRFDPTIFSAFERSLSDFMAIHLRYRDWSPFPTASGR